MSPPVAIRKLTDADAPEFARLLASNREAHAPFRPCVADSYFTVAAQRALLAGDHDSYGIVENGSLAGVVELSNVVRGPFQSATLGYWVDDSRCGRGLATAAVAAIVDVAFDEYELHRLEAATLVDNAASQRVLAKNGFVRIGLAPGYLEIAGQWQDHVLFQRTP